MSHNDLIRRGDAINAVDDWQGDWSCTVLALSALPAVQPDLSDPNVVHANMLRGTIARPTVDQIRHIYGSELTALHALAPDWPTQIDDILSNFAGSQRRLGAEFERALAEDIGKLYEGGPVQPDATAIRETALIKALENIRELNLSGADEHGHRWANSDLIEQEIVFALTGKETK